MAEVDVRLWAGLRPFADGQVSVRVEARTIRDMLCALAHAHPGLQPIIDQGVSVAIDGEIHTDSLVEPVAAGQEIVLMQKLSGG